MRASIDLKPKICMRASSARGQKLLVSQTLYGPRSDSWRTRRTLKPKTLLSAIRLARLRRAIRGLETTANVPAAPRIGGKNGC